MHGLIGVAANLREGLDVAVVLTEIAMASKAALRASRATCYVHDIDSQTVADLYTTETDERARRALSAAVGHGPDRLPIWRLHHSQTDEGLLVIEDVAHDRRLPRDLAKRIGAGAVLGVKLEHESVRASGGPLLLGTLYCSFDGPRGFDRDQLRAVRGLASVASLALANAYLQVQTAHGLTRARELEHEQAALRRVATTVAAAGNHGGVHSATAREVTFLLDADAALVVRFDDGHATVVGAHGGHSEIGTTLPLDGPGVLAEVARTGVVQRVSDYRALPAQSPIRAHALAGGYRASTAAPVHVDGRLWGAVLVTSRAAEVIAAGAELRLTRFAELSALAIASVEARARLEHRATHDDLTGLANHRAFFESLDRECTRARDTGGTLALIMIDLDHFKSINDSFGHLAGDRVLVEFAEHLRSAVREGDTLARTGGEEFAWILPGADIDASMVAAERLRARVAGVSSAEVGRVTMSAGVAATSGDDSAAELFAAADGALYEAKRAGRNTCCAAPRPRG